MTNSLLTDLFSKFKSQFIGEEIFVDKLRRNELKFYCRTYELESVYLWLSQSLGQIERHFTKRIVNNIYFDTLDYQSMRDNLAGLSDRVKVRLRWYGDCRQKAETASLEFKTRKNRLGGKTSQIINQLDLTTQWLEIRRSIEKELNPEQQLIFNHFRRSVLQNRYLRSYFISRDKMVRITIDTDIEFFDLRLSNKLAGSTKATAQEYAIVEISIIQKSGGKCKVTTEHAS